MSKGKSFASMLRLLLKVIGSMLAFLASSSALLTVVCDISNNEPLIMLHMYFSPIVLSVALGLILLLTAE